MKKKIKVALLSLLLIPCMFILTACEKSINVADYNEKLAECAEEFYDGYQNKDKTIITKNKSVEKYSKALYVADPNNPGSSHSVTCDFEEISEVTQTIIYDAGETNTAMKVITETVVTEKGSRLTEDELSTEKYSEVTQTTITDTYVNNGIEAKVYHSVDVKVNGVLDEIASSKGVFAYYSNGELHGDVFEFIDDVNEELFEESFFASSTVYSTLSIIMGGSLEYFKNGDDSFGVRFSYCPLEISDKEVVKGCGCMEVLFDDDKPSTYNYTIESKGGSRGYDELNKETNLYNKMEGSIQVKYTSASITAPAGFEEASTLGYVPEINIVSAGGLSL